MRNRWWFLLGNDGMLPMNYSRLLKLAVSCSGCEICSAVNGGQVVTPMCSSPRHVPSYAVAIASLGPSNCAGWIRPTTDATDGTDDPEIPRTIQNPDPDISRHISTPQLSSIEIQTWQTGMHPLFRFPNGMIQTHPDTTLIHNISQPY